MEPEYEKPSRRIAIQHIHRMLGEIRRLASVKQLRMVDYLTEMAYIEVCDILRGQRTANGIEPTQKQVNSQLRSDDTVAACEEPQR